MYDKALAIEILQQIFQALRTILQRFEPVKSPDDFTRRVFLDRINRKIGTEGDASYLTSMVGNR